MCLCAHRHGFPSKPFISRSSVIAVEPVLIPYDWIHCDFFSFYLVHFSVSESTFPLVVSLLLHCLRLLAWDIFPDFLVDELHLLGSCKSQGILMDTTTGAHFMFFSDYSGALSLMWWRLCLDNHHCHATPHCLWFVCWYQHSPCCLWIVLPVLAPIMNSLEGSH